MTCVNENSSVARILDPEGAHLAALRRLADFGGLPVSRLPFATTSLDCYMFEIVLLRVSDGSLRVVYRTDYGELYGIDWK